MTPQITNSNVIPFLAGRRASEQPYAYQRQRDIMRAIEREWFPYLSPSQFQVLSRLFGQSVDMMNRAGSAGGCLV